MSKRVTITRDDGELGTIDESELDRAQASGFRVVDDKEARTIEKRREAQSAGGMAIGGAEALLRGVSVGTSDPILRSLGVDMEAAQARKENLGTLGSGAELVGAIAPALLTRGGSLAARTPAALVARAGAAAERAAVQRGGGRVLGAAVQGGVEGFAGGVGQAVSSQALADQDLDVERAIAGGVEGLGIGALLGGGLGVTGRALEYGATKTATLGRAGLERAGGLVQRQGENLADLSPSESRWSGLGRSLAKLQGRDPESYAKLYGGLGSRKGRDRILADMEEVQTSSARTLKETADAYNEAAEGAIASISNARRGAKADELLAELDTPGRRVNGRFVRRPRSFAKEHLEQQNSRLRDELEDPLLSKQAFADLSEAIRLNEQAQRGIGKKASEAFLAVDDYKRSIDALAAKREKYYRTNRSPETEAAWKRAKSFSDDTRRHLENEDLYGPLAASQRRRNAALSAEFTAREALPPHLKAFLEKGAVADTATAMSLARGASRYGGQTRQDAFRAALDARDNVFKMAREEGSLSPDELRLLDAAEAQGAALRAKLDDTAETAEVADLLQKARKDEGGGSPSLTMLSTFGPTAGAGVGFMLGGIPGAIVGSAAGLVMRPFTLAKGLAAAGNMLERFKFGTEAVTSRQESIVANFERLADGGRAAARAASRSSRRALQKSAGTEPPEGRAGRQARLLAVRAAVMAAGSDPLQVAAQMEAQVAELHDEAPEVARSIVERSAVAVLFLASKAPDVYESEFGSKVQLVDPAALDRFERYVEAVQDPLSAVERISRGVFDAEAAEALRVVYPKIFAELQSKVLEMVGRRKQEGRPTSHEARVQLGLLLDMPLDESLAPGFLSTIQKPPPPPIGAGPAPSVGRPGSRPIEITGQRTDLGRLESGELRG
jgi:gas vesicle protein